MTWLAALSAGFLTWLIVFVVAVRLIPVPAMHPAPVWTSTSGQPPDDRFSILMFPATSSVPLFDKPGGVQTGRFLQRALANTAAEVEAAGWAYVPETTGPTHARFADLSFQAPPGQEKPLLEALARSLDQRAPDPPFTVSLVRKTISGGERITAKIHSDDYHYDSTYTVINGHVTPEQLVLVNGKLVGFSGLPSLFISALVAALFAVFVICKVLRRAKRRSIANPVTPSHQPA